MVWLHLPATTDPHTCHHGPIAMPAPPASCRREMNALYLIYIRTRVYIQLKTQPIY